MTAFCETRKHWKRPVDMVFALWGKEIECEREEQSKTDGLGHLYDVPLRTPGAMNISSIRKDKSFCGTGETASSRGSDRSVARCKSCTTQNVSAEDLIKAK